MNVVDCQGGAVVDVNAGERRDLQLVVRNREAAAYILAHGSDYMRGMQLNAKGELVGLAFDGTLDSIISDWDFNKANTRDIQVDLRYILWNMKYVDKAGNLLKEMGAE